MRSDLLAAEVQVSEFRQQKIQAIGDLATAQTALNTALGLSVHSSHTITDQLSDDSSLLRPRIKLNRLALQNRPEYARARLAVRVNARQLRGVRDESPPARRRFL